MKRLLTCTMVDGGICHYTYSLADALQQTGDEVTVLMTDYKPYELQEIPHSHQTKTTLRMAGSPVERVFNILRNRQTLRQEARDVPLVHFQLRAGPRTDRIQWQALKHDGKKIVYTAHDVVPHEPTPEEMRHNNWIYENADAVIVHGDKLKDLVIQVSGIPSEKVHIIPLGNYNFMADRLRSWNRTSARASFGLTEDQYVVLFFGYIRPYKGLDTLIDACGLVKHDASEQSKRLHLLIAGGSVSAEDYWSAGGYGAKVQENGLAEQTTSALEYIALADIPRYFLAADVVALPYKRGSQSAILQLAYSFSKPVVVTNVGSITDVVQDGVTGWVVPPEDPTAFAQALSEVMADPVRAAHRGRQGRSYAENELSWGKIAVQTRKLYDHITA